MEEGVAAQARRSHGKVSRLIQGLTLAIILASLLFFVFYFAVRPAILKNEDRRERLDWLEGVLEDRSGEAAVSDILDLYRKTFSP